MINVFQSAKPAQIKAIKNSTENFGKLMKASEKQVNAIEQNRVIQESSK